jgi:hypothetical protein
MLLYPSDSKIADCLFSHENWLEFGSSYTCKVQDKLNICSRESSVIDQIVGLHECGKTNEYVTVFHSDGNSIEYFPRGLTELFPNLKIIYIEYGRLKELTQDDLKPFVHLEALGVWENDIMTIEDGIFSHNPKLMSIVLENNKITRIGQHVFDNHDQIYRLILTNNYCIDLRADTSAEVKLLIELTKVKCYSGDLLTTEKLSE